MEMLLRLTVALFFGASALLLLYAYFKQRHVPHLFGISVWCWHVVLFTMMTTFRAAGFLSIDAHFLNVWSNIVRLHGGIMVFSTAIYYLSKKEFIS
jgi:hypothetical protein